MNQSNLMGAVLNVIDNRIFEIIFVLVCCKSTKNLTFFYVQLAIFQFVSFFYISYFFMLGVTNAAMFG